MKMSNNFKAKELELKMNHDVILQDLSVKMNKMQLKFDEQKQKLESIQKLLAQEKSTVLQLRMENAKLKNTQNLSTKANKNIVSHISILMYRFLDHKIKQNFNCRMKNMPSFIVCVMV